MKIKKKVIENDTNLKKKYIKSYLVESIRHEIIVNYIFVILKKK